MFILKLHYFLWFGSLSGILPYVPIFAQQHAIATATDVGILFFILPFIASIVKPIFCSMADHYQAHKKIFITFLLLTLNGYGLLLSIPFVTFMGKYSWYLFSALVLVANSSMGVVISLTDFLVMKQVTQNNQNYGSYRVYGTLGWGGFGLLAGYINDSSPKLPFLLPGLIMFTAILATDLAFVCVFMMNKDEPQKQTTLIATSNAEMIKEEDKPVNERVADKISILSIVSSISQVFKEVFGTFLKHPSLFQYTILVIIFGILTGFHWSFYFWYIQEIRGKDPLLLGLTLFVQCAFGELPFFLLAHRIVKLCGPAFSLTISLSAFALRYVAYGYILQVGDSYWDVLLVEVTQGPTYSLFYCVMTHIAQLYADKAQNQRISHEIETNHGEVTPNQSTRRTTHATMQGIMSACFEGIGLGIGSLIAGLMIDRVGVFEVWRYAAFFTIGAVLFNLSIELIKYIRRKSHVTSAIYIES